VEHVGRVVAVLYRHEPVEVRAEGVAHAPGGGNAGGQHLVPEHEEVDGRDDDALHLVAINELGEVIATCRLLFTGATVQFSRLAVDRNVRRRGIARALLEEAERETLAAGARRMVLHAQTYAQELYAENGFEPRGEVFYEAGIEHIAMEKALA
jgi:predicted GNAT family N-acyltransferase